MVNAEGRRLPLWYIPLFIALILLPPQGAEAQDAALEVDMAELERGQTDPVVFINYEGPHARIETLNQIREIGFSLGRAVRGGAGRSGGLGRYFVIHSVSGRDGDKLDSDIFGLGVDAGVDHIRNLRLIIQGFLEGAYDYSLRDAALIAEYTTIYNAVFRGSWDYFNARYKEPVIRSLLPDRAGLSIRFDEWPGRTMMLIPLARGVPGSLSAVDTSSLTEARVIEEMRNREDMGIEQRRDMVDLKEREAEEAEETAVLQREAIREEESRIAQERAETAAERNAIDRERQELRADESSGTTPEERREAEAALAEREAAAEEKEAELDQREAALEEQREEAERTEEFAERKAGEAQQERQDIAVDQQGIIVREDSLLPAAGGLLGIRLLSADSALGRVVRVNAGTGEELRASALDTVNGRSLTLRSGRIIAIAGEERGSGAIRLVEINPETLEMVRQGEDDIHPQSLLWVNGADLYAITSSAAGPRLARFNADLVRQARSSVTLHPYASLSFQDDIIVTQRADGSPAALNGGDLTERR
jgi:hypothetical protein